MSPAFDRVMPEVTLDTEFFWTSGRDGQLRIQHCDACDEFIHPPAPRCPACGGGVGPRVVSGRGWVWSATVNHHSWSPGQSEPYVVALVELDEQPGLRLTTNIVGCTSAAVTIGLPVRVRFEDHDPIYLPLFEPRPLQGDEQV